MRSNWKVLLLLLAILAMVATAGVLLVRSYLPPPEKIIAAVPAATAPATTPAATTQLADYPALLKYAYSSIATTEPSAVALPLNESAHVRMTEPVFCDSAGELWITSPLAPPTAQVLSDARTHHTHLVRERVLFVPRVQNANGSWQPQLIVRNGGSIEWITPERRTALADADALDWSAAVTWAGDWFVPTADGATAWRDGACGPDGRLTFSAPAAGQRRVQLLPDQRGVLAWEACDDADALGHGAFRWAQGRWIKLDDWPQNIVQINSLLDGGYLTIALDAEHNASVTRHTGDSPTADPARIAALIDQLSDPVAATRAAAYGELQRWGAGAWVLLEKAQPDQPPEAQVRIGQLLAARDRPSLFGFDLLPGPLRVLARDGQALMLRADAGVSYQREGDANPTVIKPAYVMIDEHGVQIAPAALASAIETGGAVSHVDAEWLVTTPIDGPRWWIANHLGEPLLRRGERDFTQLIDIDARGRWLLRRPNAASPTLIIDPSLPDAQPRLPVWTYVLQQGSTGWTSGNWPAIKSGGTWALVNNDWTTVARAEDYLTQLHEPATEPMTQSSSPLLTDRRGYQYFAAAKGLTIVRPDRSKEDWSLPEPLRGEKPPHYLAAAGRIFECGEPGRIVRISIEGETPKIDATFTHNLPTESIRRMWIDPAGRIDFAFGEAGLAVCFPDGKIPKAFADKMTAESLRQAEEDEPATQP